MPSEHPVAVDRRSGVVDPGLARFNALPDARACQLLLACCAASTWAEAVNAGRPYPDRAALRDAAGRATSELDHAGVTAALAAHPRIGDRPAGTGLESRWSQSEQGGVERDGDTLERLSTGNQAYEEKFGHVFLICASGLDAAQVLAALELRLGNDPDSEWQVVRDEVRKIARLRLERALDAEPTPTAREARKP